MAICLGINDDLVKLFQRYDDLKKNKKPNGFVSSFHTEYASYNLNYKNTNNQIGAIKTEPINNKPPGNQNLLDLDFFQPPVNIPPGNVNNNNNSNNTSNQPKTNVNDINDLFDILNQK
jgi:hypothetical protein